jgi:hypothetical protein
VVIDVLGIPLLAGRVFETTTPPDQVVINEALARRLWPGQPAPSRVFRDGDRDLRVIGVAADDRTAGFNAAAPAYYTRAEAFPSVLIRGDPAAIAQFQAIVRRLEPAVSPAFTELASGVGRGLQAHVVGAVVAGPRRDRAPARGGGHAWRVLVRGGRTHEGDSAFA